MLAIQNLTFRIEGKLLFEAASATIPGGHKAGFVGRNGAGKSTLLKIIAGELSPESGGIQVPRSARIGMVAQEAPGGPDSLIDTVLAADTERAALLSEAETAADPHRIADIQTRLADIGAHSARARAAEILAGLGFSAEAQDRPCAEFSGGWRMRVALAAVLFSAPDLLLLDEPTNYLDLEGVVWLEAFLSRYPHTVLLVSHDRDLLNRAVDCILHLENRKLSVYTGGYDVFARTRAMKLALQEAQRKKIDAQRAHMQAYVDRFRYKASKARQAQSRLKAIAKLGDIPPVLETEAVPFRFPDPEELAPPLLTMDGASAGYGGPPVLSRLTLRIDDDDRIALLGANGNGKSTFAKLAAGRLQPTAGTLSRARKLSVGFFAQHQLDELDADGTAVSHLARLMPLATETQVRARLGAYGFGADKADTVVTKLSGGEKARLLFALATFHAPQLLILDEPTNHLDIDSREALVRAINDYRGAVILISHDRHLVETCADTLWLVADGRVAPYDGDLDDYRKLLLARRSGAARANGDADKASRADMRRAAADKRQALAPLKKAADAAEKIIRTLTDEIAKLDAALHDPALYARDPKQATALATARAEAAKALAEAETAWLTAQEAYEAAAQEE